VSTICSTIYANRTVPDGSHLAGQLAPDKVGSKHRLRLIALASSTIGNGTQTAGLTVSGGATTTKASYFIGNVGAGTIAPVAQLDVTGLTLIRGSNTNTPPTPIAGLELFFGRTASGGGVGGVGIGDVAFDYGGSGGGYRHWITTTHNAGTTGNSFNIWLNNSGTAGGSSVPGTGNELGLTIQNGPKIGIGTSSPATTLVAQGPAQFVIASGVATSTCTTVIEGSQVYDLGNHHLWLCMGAEPWTLLK